MVKGPERLLGMVAQAKSSRYEHTSLAGAGKSLLLSPASDVMVRFFASSSGCWGAGAGAGAGSIFVLCQYFQPFSVTSSLVLSCSRYLWNCVVSSSIWRLATGVLVLGPALLELTQY